MKWTSSRVLPPYPGTVHLPYKPNASKDDIIASEREAKVIFGGHLSIEEKIDGASVGMVLFDDHPIIRSKDYILRKGNTKGQFATIWNWFYDHQKRFKKIAALGPFSVYGEWMVRSHGIFYSSLPDWFIPYDLYNYVNQVFLSPVTARRLLTEAGFSVPALRFQGKFEDTYDDLEKMATLPAEWAEGPAEGIYIKVCNQEVVKARFKMVRPDFQRGSLWDQDTRNTLKISKSHPTAVNEPDSPKPSD